MLSKYVYKLDINNGNILLYNALNKALIEVPRIEDWDENELDNESIEYFKRNHFLVQVEEDDKAIIEEYLLETKYSGNILSFTVHVNYDCNLMCTYCYQHSIKKNVRMEKQTIDKILAFISYLCKIEKPLILDLGIIGGEPLLSYEKIIYFLTKVQEIKCRFKRISLITNGVFLTVKKYEELSRLGVSFFQITLDGIKEIHDTKRYGGNGEGSFDTIIENVKKISYIYPNNKIIINYNLDKDTYSGVKDFFEYLEKRNIICKVIFSEVFDSKDNVTGKEIELTSKIWCEAHKIAIDHGQRYDPFYRMSYLACGIKKNNSFMINPNGEIYKCISAMEDKNYLVGTIEEFQTHMFSINMSKFIEEEYKSTCLECKYFPVCGGGCVYRNKEKQFKCYKRAIEMNDLQIIKYQYEKENKLL